MEQTEEKKPKYPVLDDRLIRTMKFQELKKSWKFKPDQNYILENYIYPDKNKSLTYMSLEFLGVRLIKNRNIIAQVAMSKKDRRFEMQLNIDKIKSLYWINKLERVLRKPFGFEMPAPHNPPSRDDVFWASLTDAKAVPTKDINLMKADMSKKMNKIFSQVIQHEFGHIWFWHLKADLKNCPKEVKPYLNIAQDGLVNFHLGVDLGRGELEAHPTSSQYVSLLPILFPQLEINYLPYMGMPLDEFRDKFKDPKFDDYRNWRIIASQVKNFKKIPIATIASRVLDIRRKIIKYEAGVMEIAEDIKNLFPDKQHMDFTCALHIHGDDSISGGKDEDGFNPSDYIPITDMSIDDIPPQFQKLLENTILPNIGLGGNMLDRMLGEIKKVTLQNQLLKTLSAYAEKDPARFITKTLKDLKLNKVDPTYRPTKHPIAKQMALANSLSRSAPAQFYPKHTVQELKSMNKLRMYLDVSGSYWHMSEKVMAMIRALEAEFEMDVWQFSTEVHPITKEDIINNKTKTTGGTDGNCILDHMRKSCDKVANFIVLGDRWYGDIANPDFPVPITVLDITTDPGNQNRPWFIRNKNVKVGSLFIDEDFLVKNEVSPF